jgi:LysM repeat protein
MPDRRRRSPARLVAPLALLAVAAAVAAVLASSNVTGGDGGDTSEQATDTSTEEAVTATERQRTRRRATYTVKLNDTLGVIAERTGVSVERLQELNPEVDPQALVAGQKIKLRE